MDGNSSTTSYQNALRSTIMAQMNAALTPNTTSSAASSSTSSPTSTSHARPTTTMLPVARIDSPQPDNRVNLARVMYRLSDLIAHLHVHHQATMPHGEDAEPGTFVPKSRQTSTEFKLWIGKTRRAALQALAIRARTQVAVLLPGFMTKKSKVLGECTSHLEEYFGLFCSNIATAAGVKHSIVHDLGFASSLVHTIGVSGRWIHVADGEVEMEREGHALGYAVVQTFAFPNTFWALRLAAAGAAVLVKIE